MPDNYRDCKAWADMKLPISTTSNEAAKMYDAAILQIMSYKEDHTLGGLEQTVKSMLEADPNFIMGQILAVTLDLTDCPDENDRAKINEISKLAENSALTEREKMHLECLKLKGLGAVKRSTEAWNRILMSHPLDIHALQMSNQGYLHLGDTENLQNGIARVLPYWKRHHPGYSMLYALYGFGLEECNRYDEAMKAIETSLDHDITNSWAHHSRSHVYEMTGRVEEGIKVLEKNENHWKSSEILTCHNYWHWGLFNVERGNFEEALQIYDVQIKPRIKGFIDKFAYSDAVSLLYRMKIEGFDLGDRWSSLHESLPLDYYSKRESNFYDSFYILGCLNAQDPKAVQSILETNVPNGGEDYLMTRQEVALSLQKAAKFHHEEKYAEAVELLYPVRYQIYKIGGSIAQKDMYNWILIDSASKSNNDSHKLMAEQLINERRAKKNTSAIDRMHLRLMNAHRD